MKPPDLSALKRTFAAPTPLPQDHALLKARVCSAVAVIFGAAAGQLSLCYVRRAPFPGDPWSGDMAFPGGKADRGDRSFHDIAARETFEEIGLHLEQRHLVGTLPGIDVQPRTNFPKLLLKPMVYLLDEEPAPFQLSSEIAAGYWIPAPSLWDLSRRTSVDWGHLNVDYPGIEHEGEVIWGLTYRVLEDCAVLLGHPLGRPS